MRLRSRSWTENAARQHAEEELQAAQTRDQLQQFTQAMKNHEAQSGWKAVILKQGKTFSLLLISWLLLVLYIRYPRAVHEEHLPSTKHQHAEIKANLTLPPANLHLLIPGNKADPNLCKVVVSAAIAGYPTPVIINWNQTFVSPEYVDGGSHLGKIDGIYNYLARLDASQDDDLVLMADGYDIWFNLRPQTLIDRYFEINRRADERVAAKLGNAAKTHDIHQEIIFGCQKRCWPWEKTDPPCYAVPNSTLPNDIYGPETDTDIGYEANPYIKYRPRFINSGVAIGTVKAMKKLFSQALILLDKEKNIGSDQYIFSHILGDQEIWREIVRRDNQWSAAKLANELLYGDESHPFFNPKHIQEVREKAAERDDKNFEFHLGLDYGSEIGLNTVFAEDDTAWLTWSDEPSLRAAESKLGIPAAASRLRTLAADITATVPPFWTFSDEPALPRWTSWLDIPLFTNVWTGTVPAVIHHNAHRDGRKALRETWWDRIWFQKHARTLYDVSVYAPVLPVAYSGYSRSALRAWWPSETWKGGAKNGPMLDSDFRPERWIPFDDMCRDFHEEVFRDGKGPWRLPAVH